MRVLGEIASDGRRLLPESQRQAQEKMRGKGFRCGRCGVARNCAVSSSEWIPNIVDRQIYSVACMASRQKKNDIDAMNITYKFPEDENSKWKTSALRVRYGELPGVLDHEFPSTFEMYELMAQSSSANDEVGDTRGPYDQNPTGGRFPNLRDTAIITSPAARIWKGMGDPRRWGYR